MFDLNLPDGFSMTVLVTTKMAAITLTVNVTDRQILLEVHESVALEE